MLLVLFALQSHGGGSFMADHNWRLRYFHAGGEICKNEKDSEKQRAIVARTEFSMFLQEKTRTGNKRTAVAIVTAVIK